MISYKLSSTFATWVCRSDAGEMIVSQRKVPHGSAWREPAVHSNLFIHTTKDWMKQIDDSIALLEQVHEVLEGIKNRQREMGDEYCPPSLYSGGNL